MSQLDRIGVAAGGFITNTVFALFYVRAVAPTLQMAISGKYQGPFTGVAELAMWVPAVVIGVIYLVLAAWVIAGPVQEERAATVKARGRRRP
jgi:hypothetical protein